MISASSKGLDNEMSWKTVLKADPLSWLLEQENPPVCYFSLVDILERDVRSAQVAAAKAEIMKRGIVPAILARQKKGGYWDKREDFYIQHHIYKRSHELTRTAKAKWLKFGFPTIWDLDVLETLVLLTRLGFRDTRMQGAVDLALSKEDEQGRWTLENTFNGRFQVNIEKKGKPSKWVTLNALRALKGYLE